MPIYEYQCSKCEHVFEKIQKISDSPVRSCPECRGRVKKLVSQSAFVLKGGGWYSDGYSSKGGPKKAPSGTGSSSNSPKTKAKESSAKSSGSESSKGKAASA